MIDRVPVRWQWAQLSVKTFIVIAS